MLLVFANQVFAQFSNYESFICGNVVGNPGSCMDQRTVFYSNEEVHILTNLFDVTENLIVYHEWYNANDPFTPIFQPIQISTNCCGFFWITSFATLPPGEYFVQVTYEPAGGGGKTQIGYSLNFTVLPPCVPIDNFSVTETGHTWIKLEWSDPDIQYVDTYEIEYRESGASTWLPIKDDPTCATIVIFDVPPPPFSLALGLKPCTNYEFRLKKYCQIGGTIHLSGIISGTTDAQCGNPYFSISNYTAGLNNCSAIEYFDFGGIIDVNNGCDPYTPDSELGYEYLVTDTAKVEQGKQYPLNLNINGGEGTHFIGAWIDFNKNGTFDNPSERVLQDQATLGDFCEGYGSVYLIDIPANAPLGLTRMRVVTRFGTTALPHSGVMTQGGRVEDMNIQVGKPSGGSCRNGVDSLALIKLYQTTNGATQWINKSNWLMPGKPISTWYGVRTDINGCVDTLFLNNNNLVGPIPPEIGNLVDLKALRLHTNQLLLSIPAEIGRLAKLEELDLSLNPNLSGVITDSIGKLDSLKQLFLNNCAFTGKIPNGLTQLKNLEALNLSWNQLTDGLPVPIQNWSKLKKLWINNNQLTGNLPITWGQFPLLSVLNLSTNQLAGPIPGTLGGLPLIDTVYLNQNLFGGCLDPGLKPLCSSAKLVSIANNPGLSTQDWNAFCTGDSGICKVCNRATDSLALVSLFNATQGPATWTRPWNLNKPLPTPAIFVDTSNWYGVVVGLDGCVLYLDLDGKFDANYPNGVDYGGNGLSGSLPPELGNLTRIERLYLSNNNLEGPIPAELGKLDNLEELFIYNSRLSGNIPPTLGNLSKLKGLDLYTNNLEGSIPKELGKLTNLQGLYLSKNNLSGSIPTELSNLKKLGHLYIGDNNLSGNIPNLSLPNLVQLFLYENELTGTLPTFDSMPSLELMWMGRNLLKGDLPNFNLPNLKSLVLESNQLSGLIPNWVLPNLEEIRLEGNQLGSPLPNLGGCPKLNSYLIFSNKMTFDGMPEAVIKNYSFFFYAPQDSFFSDTLIVRKIGDSLTVDLGIDQNVTGNEYEWFKSGFPWNKLDNNKIVFDSLTLGDAGVYHCKVTNPNALQLQLYSRSIEIQIAGCSLTNQPMLPASDSLCTGSLLTLSPGSGYTNYQWSTGANTSFISITTEGQYTVTITESNGCTGVAKTTVVQVDNPIAVASGDTLPCNGNPVITLTGQSNHPNSTYAWSGPGNFSSSLQDPVVSQAGVYTLTVTNSAGCTDEADAWVYSSAPFTAFIDAPNGTQLHCQLNSLILSAIAQPSGNNYTYVWSNNLGIDPQILVSASGTYAVTITDTISGCAQIANLDVSGSINPPIATAAGGLLGCNNSLTLMGSSDLPNASFSWSGPNNFTSTVQNPIVSEPGTYTLTVTTPGNCIAVDTATVVFNNISLTPTINGVPQVCSGGSTLLDAGGGYVSYLWSTGATTQLLQVGQPGLYLVTVTDGQGCTGSTQVNVVSGNQLMPQITGVLQVCAGGSTLLDAGTGYVGYLWSTGATTRFIQVAIPGTYAVTVTDGQACTGATQVVVTQGQPVDKDIFQMICKGDTLFYQGDALTVAGTYPYLLKTLGGCDSTVMLTLELRDTGFIDAKPDTLYFPVSTQTALIAVTGNDIMPAGGGWAINVLQHPKHGVDSTENQNIRYTLNDPDFQGNDQLVYTICDTLCTTYCDTAELFIIIQNGPDVDGSGLPSAFSPNDDGINDLWDPLNSFIDQGVNLNPDNSSISVINRWGELLFHAEPYKPWNGKVNGRVVPAGTYYYLLTIDAGKAIIIKKPVTVLR